MRRVFAVDPGANGAIAWMDPAKMYPCFERMPEDVSDMAQRVRELPDGEWWIEKLAGIMPTDGRASAAKFCRHLGHWEGVLTSQYGYYNEVSPKEWQGWLLSGEPKMEKAARKRLIKEKVTAIFPQVRPVTLWNADALGMLAYLTRDWKR